MNVIYCNKGCCYLKTTKFNEDNIEKNYKSRYKSGIFIYSKKQNKILMVQSNGKLWGIPKGTIKKYETIEECAVREVKEETGLVIDKNDLRISTKIRKKATYYYMEKKFEDVDIQITKDNNDANSIGWIKPSCLKLMIRQDKMKVNKHFEVILNRFLNIIL